MKVTTQESEYTLAQLKAELECSVDELITAFEEKTETVVHGLKTSRRKVTNPGGEPFERTEVRADVRAV
jgi:hypothetical protein